MGGGNATKISGQVAIGARIPILALSEFGGAAAKVWHTLSAGEDLPNRNEIDLMARPWGDDSAAACVQGLFAQQARRQSAEGAPNPALSILGAILFLAALAIVPWVWGQNAFVVWMLFLAPLLSGVRVPQSAQSWTACGVLQGQRRSCLRPSYLVWSQEALRASFL